MYVFPLLSLCLFHVKLFLYETNLEYVLCSTPYGRLQEMHTHNLKQANLI